MLTAKRYFVNYKTTHTTKIMKKVYTMPEIQVNETQATSLLAASIAISNKEVDGSQALSKEDTDWNIWED